MRVNHFIHTTDVHIAGAPLRIISQHGLRTQSSMQAYQQELNQTNHLSQWNSILQEPRGHSEMILCIITPPVSNNADAGVLFRNVEGNVEFLNSGMIGVATVLAETGNLVKDEYIFDYVTGQCRVHLVFDHEKNQVKEVKIVELATEHTEQISGTPVMQVNEDNLAIINVEDVNLSLTIDHLNGLKKRATEIFKKGSFHYIVFYQLDNEGSFRILTIDWLGHIDRSPYNGATAFVTYLYKKDRGLFKSGGYTVTNFLGHTVHSRIREMDNGYSQIELTGKAYITGFHRFVIDRTDPLKGGFLVK
ncbi:proline racemase family protein [Radiobacillus kanasensis]|uniref:proline racemase family protein n=1 Tax=Radiobacillus kanasensis TaxID=2844358 RepID=UPI001E2DB6BB|nr:proline racemase family protein [Radiobacillus kanasensis]UFT98820.1 proline racemase family protein [Radiobacillus kanasensis]